MRNVPLSARAACTIPVHSPFRRGTVLITPRQYRLVAMVQDGWQGNQRDLAAATGYTLPGIESALRTLRAIGVLAVSTTRGCRGRTRLWLQRGVRVMIAAASNVWPEVRTSLKDLSEALSTRHTLDTVVPFHTLLAPPPGHPGRA
jgi:hypothetical protein